MATGPDRIFGKYVFILSIYHDFKEEITMISTTFEVGTIRQVHRYLISNGYHVSEHGLRRWVKLGVVPAAYSGGTAYISVANVLRVLENGTPTPIVH